jgi:hypothetical protein
MRNNAIPFTIALALAGCGSNPCDISLLYENMTPEQRANCDECSNAYECPEDGETGDENDDYAGSLVCEPPSGDDAGVPAGHPRWCRTFGLLPFDLDFITDWDHSLAAPGDCYFNHPPVPCVGSSTGVFLDECVLCRPYTGGPSSSAGNWTSDDNDNWDMCLRKEYLLPGVPAAGRWQPCYYAAGGGVMPEGLTGVGGEHEGPHHVCTHGFVGLEMANSTHQPITNGAWTCQCDGSDAGCQPDAVCEAGWVVGGLDGVGLMPSPTLCTYDGAPLVVGPVVYGLTQWSDGIVIDGDNIVLGPSMLLSLWPQDGQPFALFNDDQRADERGLITHCGAGSLCEHVGLHAGERIVFDGFDVDALLAGRAVALKVERPRDRARTLTISVE